MLNFVLIHGSWHTGVTLQATGDLKLVGGDIGPPETARRVVAVAMRDFGRIDLLVNNAGVFIPKPFTEYLPEDFRRATETNQKPRRSTCIP